MGISFLIPILVSGVGGFLLFRLSGLFLLHPISTASQMIYGLEDGASRSAFTLALAGTLGVGNIFGVAAGIIIGGPGVVFWIFLSSIFAMVIKYAETLLVLDVGESRGGTAAMLGRVFSNYSRPVSLIYAALTVLLSLSMGAVMQGSALIHSVGQGVPISQPTIVLILLSAFIATVVGGSSRIEKITEYVIPMTTAVYIIMCFSVIIVNRAQLLPAIKCVVFSAFNFRSISGGLSFVVIKEGFARGILSNEAGTGTSAMAHSRAKKRSPHTAGLFAMCEVLFDSVILCTLTGFTILVSVPNYFEFSDPMTLVAEAFSKVLFGIFSPFLPFVIFAFAFSTIICWYYYGSECIEVYFPYARRVFPLTFIISLAISYLISPISLIFFTDIILLFMSLLTLSAIISRIDRISEIYRNNNKTRT